MLLYLAGSNMESQPSTTSSMSLSSSGNKSSNKRNSEYLEERDSLDLKKARFQFNLFGVFHPLRPSKHGLRVFQYGTDYFITRPDLVAVTNSDGSSRFSAVNFSPVAGMLSQFKGWAKGESIAVGCKLKYLYTVDARLVQFLRKYDDSVTIAEELVKLVNLGI